MVKIHIHAVSIRIERSLFMSKIAHLYCCNAWRGKGSAWPERSASHGKQRFSVCNVIASAETAVVGDQITTQVDRPCPLTAAHLPRTCLAKQQHPAPATSIRKLAFIRVMNACLVHPQLQNKQAATWHRSADTHRTPTTYSTTWIILCAVGKAHGSI